MPGLAFRTATPHPVAVAYELLSLAARYDAERVWSGALTQAVKFIVLVMENNPGKPVKQVLLRPDVQESLTHGIAQAGATTMAQVREAWYTTIGDLEVPEGDLQRVLANVQKNTVTAPKRLRDAILHGPRDEMPHRLQVLADDLTRRSRFAVEYTLERARTLALIYGATTGQMKTWRSVDHPGRCSHCLALDGTTIALHELFDANAGTNILGTFGPLLGPPRHPNCLCFLEIT